MKENKIAIITGCEGQLGTVFVTELKRLGYFIIGVDKIKKSKHKMIEYHRVDIAKESNIKKFFNKIKNYKNIDVLINNAAYQTFSDFEKRSAKELDNSINVNLKAVILFIKYFFSFFFKKKKNGRIINIGSVYGVVTPNFKIYSKKDRKSSEIYGASKAGVIHLTKYFANYFSNYNIQVNCISPGGISNNKTQSRNFKNKYSKNVPLGRLGNDMEISECLKFLVQKKNRYLNGHNLVIDGGLTLI